MSRYSDLHKRILIVDDCEELVEWLRADLSFRGFETDTAYDGESCLARLTQSYYQFIILDVMMPGETEVADFLGRYPLYLQSTLHQPLSNLYVLQHGQKVFLEQLANVPEGMRALLTSRSDSLPSLQACLEWCVHPDIVSRFGPVYIHFDGITVCELIKSNACFEPWPHVLIFTAGGAVRYRDEEKSYLAGSAGYHLKSEYTPHLLNMIRAISLKDEEVVLEGRSSGRAVSVRNETADS